ncbi:MAG: ATP-binding protein [Bacteroidales bacterium]
MENLQNRIKELENELLLLKEKLQISQSLIKIGFWELNREKKLLFLSEESLDILNLKSDNQWITVDDLIRIIVDKDRQSFNAEINKLIHGENHLNAEFTINSESEKTNIIIKAIANASVRRKNDPENIVGIFQDVTEQKETELYLKNAKEKAEEADILKSAFLANMSHEIRTPLNAILGFSRLLTNPAIPNLQRKEYSEYITSSANNLLNLIRDIVDVSKIEAGKINIEKSNCQVNKVLNELYITFEREKIRQNKDNIQFILDEGIEDEDFTINTDPFRFHQIMINLIGNALKFTEKGHIKFGYSIQSQKFLEFYVQDSGIGIPSDKIELIFSRFGQIIDNKIKNPGGTGLGLSITKYLVERLGGEIWVESVVGRGTRFTFTLPFEKSQKPKIIFADKKEDFEVPDLENLRILAVEDDKINMILLEDTLKLYIKNVSVQKAENGLEAIEKLRNKDFDLIIMDIRMPYLNGYEATKQIRENFESPKKDIPILGLSAHALKSEIDEGKKIGMNEFLSKPIQPEDLFDKIRKLAIKAPRKTNAAENKPNDEHLYNDPDNIVDISLFKKLYKNNWEKISNTLHTYLNQVPGQINQLELYLNNMNYESLKNQAHSLKSTFKYLGRYDISEFSREIEYAAYEQNKENYIRERIEEIKAQWTIIEKNIKEKILNI